MDNRPGSLQDILLKLLAVRYFIKDTVKLFSEVFLLLFDGLALGVDHGKSILDTRVGLLREI